MEHFSFLLALRITVVKKVWVWLGEGRTLQNTDFLWRKQRWWGRRKRDGKSTRCAAMGFEIPREGEGQRRLGQGQTGRHF